MSLKIISLFGSIFTYSAKAVAVINRTSKQSWASFAVFAVCVWVYFTGRSDGFEFSRLLSDPFGVIVSMFSHSGFDHLRSNMTYLALLAPMVERKWGHLHFLSVYLLSGIFACAAYVTIYQDVSVLGASGAVSGLLAIAPFASRNLFQFLIVFFVSCAYFYGQVIAAMGQYNGTIWSNVAFLAHILGALGGILAHKITIFLREEFAYAA